MFVAILSDIHDNLWNLQTALTRLADCDAVICCGDLCSPFVIDELAKGFERQIHIVFGNNDADLFRITAKARQYPHLHLHGEFCEVQFDGKRFAVNHFDYIAKPIAHSALYDIVCFGHNHRFEIAHTGKTLMINPGSIMGAQFGPDGRRFVPPTFVIYDTRESQAQGYRIDSDSGEVLPATTADD
jgi:uncharacterized protein